jgi:hypothetical protein
LVGFAIIFALAAVSQHPARPKHKSIYYIFGEYVINLLQFVQRCKQSLSF